MRATRPSRSPNASARRSLSARSRAASAFRKQHPLFAGFLPAAPQPIAATLSAHDLVVVLGAPVFTFHVAGDFDLPRSDMQLFQITTDAEAAASAPMGTGIVGSLRLALPALTALLPASSRDDAATAPARRNARCARSDPGRIPAARDLSDDAGRRHHRRGSALASTGAAASSADPRLRPVLHHGERRARLRTARRRRRRAGKAATGASSASSATAR